MRWQNFYLKSLLAKIQMEKIVHNNQMANNKAAQSLWENKNNGKNFGDKKKSWSSFKSLPAKNLIWKIDDKKLDGKSALSEKDLIQKS